eukprot:TRINITY_DN5534_c0_g1_i1.p1 TRINITY_DN5534_c0_g1~~TRINITY_DN5534_c0_g1_i1.p1  ORF type:complete len:225 (-),score=22.10 TRINITY_DN5534_c0_g1_i1:278-931(-)
MGKKIIFNNNFSLEITENMNSVFPEYEKETIYYYSFLVLLFSYLYDYFIAVRCFLNQLIMQSISLIQYYGKLIKEKTKKILRSRKFIEMIIPLTCTSNLAEESFIININQNYEAEKEIKTVKTKKSFANKQLEKLKGIDGYCNTITVTNKQYFQFLKQFQWVQYQEYLKAFAMDQQINSKISRNRGYLKQFYAMKQSNNRLAFQKNYLPTIFENIKY